MKIEIQRRPDGIALMVVMIAVFVLAMLAAAFAYSMKVETQLAINATHQSGDFWEGGMSGVEAARWVLAQQMTCPYVSLNQKWAGGPGDDCDTNSPLADIALDSLQLSGRKISIQITDLERKFNINTADPIILQEALKQIGADASEISDIASSIVDWIDANDMTVDGAESDFYESLQPPYYAKNRPIDDLTELLLVRGVTHEMYWGLGATNRAPAALGRVDRFGRPVSAPSYTVGFNDLFTPISSGRININTASAEVLQLIPLVDENIAAGIIEERARAPFERLDFVPVPPQVMPQLQRWGAVSSQTFQVVVKVEGSTREFVAILGRKSPRDIPILSFYWKDR